MERTESKGSQTTSPYDIRLAQDSVREAIGYGVSRKVLDEVAQSQSDPEIRDAMLRELGKLSDDESSSS